MLKTIVFIALWFPVTLLGQTDSLDDATEEYFRPKAGDYYLRGNASWINFADISILNVFLGYKMMITDKRFYGGSVGFNTVESHSFIMLGPIYGINFTKNTFILNLPTYPFIMGYLPIISSSDDNIKFGIVSYFGSTFPLKGRFGLTPSIMAGYTSVFFMGFRVVIEIDPNKIDMEGELVVLVKKSSYRQSNESWNSVLTNTYRIPSSVKMKEIKLI